MNFSRFAGALLLVIIVTFTGGCASNRATATVSPDADLTKLKSFYVVQLPQDQRGIDKLIAANLAARGFNARSGPDTGSPPAGVDAVVTYTDRWMWDITMYMIELTVMIRDPANNFPMASANSFHTSLTRKSPPEMVDEVLTNIFSAQTNAQGGSK
jgi:hypothetical protein